ncbi:Interleukin-5 receptor subunit alpha [Pitangus sulphuratus]|nr:Interleukin-5 receptor subunit alpha [Pitangus sulphuratus]
MKASRMQVCLILLWTTSSAQPNAAQAAGVQVFPPVNFTLTVSALAQVLLHWEPNPDQDQENYTIRYDVKILSPVPEEAFEFRYKNYTEECHSYGRDRWDRNTECSFPGTHIDPEEVDDLVIHINGSSKQAPIKPFQQLFNQNAIEKVNIPRNITVSLEGNDLLATWEKPISLFHEECFEYEFYLINLKSGNKQILKLSSNKFRLRIDVTSRYSIQLRANHHPWCVRGVWSDWSEVIYVGQNKLESSVSWILAVLCVSTSCTFLLVTLICKINRVWSKLFPPIPTPSNKFPDPFPVDYEIG